MQEELRSASYLRETTVGRACASPRFLPQHSSAHSTRLSAVGGRHETGAADLPPMHPARKSIAEADGLKPNSRFPEVLPVDLVWWGEYKYTDAVINILIVGYYKLAKIKIKK